jgi:thiaminase
MSATATAPPITSTQPRKADPIDYGSSFHAKLRAEAGPAWTAYVEHPFVRGLEDGSLPKQSFLHYLQQDYVYLIHYTRDWALAAAKSTDIDEMREFAGSALALIDGEMQLHIETCEAIGISRAALAASRFQLVAERTLGPDFKASPRWQSSSGTFATACRLETAFWSMGLRGSMHPDFAN